MQPNQSVTFTLPRSLGQLRQRLDNLSQPGALPPVAGELKALKGLWEETYKPTALNGFAGVIEDRFSLVETKLGQQTQQ